VFSGEGGERLKAIETSIRAKASIVEADEREESGTRALLNLGHTFGHALEAFAGYSDRLLHGEAIAIGMRLAFSYSVEQGLCPAEDAARVERHLAEVGLPGRIADIPGKPPSTGQILRLMAQDKKVKGGKLALVLVHGIGQAFVERDVPLDRLTDFLERECATR
jgi:3-dehydroquinate synthetase